MKKFIKWMLFLLGIFLLNAYVTQTVFKKMKPVYQTGTLTKGNPDNSYLDSCDIYCCGD